MIGSLHRFLANDRNALVGAASVVAGSVLPAEDTAFPQAATRVGSARAVLSGGYTGQADATLALEIVSATGTGILSDPVFVGAGNGALTDLEAGALPGQDFTLLLASTGTATKAAAAAFYGVRLEAATGGAAGNGITLRTETDGIVAAPTVYSFLEAATAGTSEFTGAQWDFGCFALDADGNLDSRTPRLRFGHDPQVYRQHKEWVDGDWKYLIDPPLVRDLPVETKVYALTGSYTLTVTSADVSPVVETYVGLVTLFDGLNALRTRSSLLTVAGVVVEDRTPGGMAVEEWPLRTDAYGLPAKYSGSETFPGLDAVEVPAAAPTEIITLACVDISTLGGEIWAVAGTVTGPLPECTSGVPYFASGYGWTVPQIFPDDTDPNAKPKGKIFVKDIVFASRAISADEQDITLCINPLVAGAKAKAKTIEVVYTKKPSNDCRCEDADIRGNLNEKCLGVDLDEENGMAISGGYQARIEALEAWRSAFVAGNMQITAAGELRSADLDIKLAELTHDELASCLRDLYSLGALSETPWAANTAKTVDSVVEPTARNGYRYRCTVAGTTHASTQPTWPTTVGNTVTDGTVTWKCVSKVPEYAWDDLLAAVTSELAAIDDLGTFAIPVIESLQASTAYSVGDIAQIGVSGGSPVYAVCIEAGTTSTDTYFVSTGATGVGYQSTWGTAVFKHITQSDAYALAGGTANDVNATDSVLGDPGIVRDPQTFAQKYRAACDVVRSLAGILPKGDANSEGSDCWQPCDGEFEWRLNGSEYLPACTNAPYHSCILQTDSKGNETVVSTQEFGFIIRCACPDRLLPGDKFTIVIENDAAEAKTYQLGDTIKIPVVAAQPLELAGGVDGDDTLTWTVRGSLGEVWPDYIAPIGAEPVYDDLLTPHQLAFKITQGGIPFALGDYFTFSAAGGTFRWRWNTGAWQGPTALTDAAIELSDGLSVTFAPGPAPAFVADDAWAFRVLQPHAPDRLLAPDRRAWRWAGSGTTLTATFDSAVPPVVSVAIDAVAIWHDCPAGATFTLAGLSAADAVLWTKTITYRAGLTAAILENNDPECTCVKLRLTVANATGGGIKWLWAGTPWTPDHPCSSVQLSYMWALARGTDAARYLGKGAAGEIAWEIAEHSWIESTDWADLLALLEYLKSHGDQPFVFLANRDFPAEARLVRVQGDDVAFDDRFQFQYSPRRVMDVRLPLTAVRL